MNTLLTDTKPIDPAAPGQVMDMIAEWRRGCSCASAGHPEQCSDCTVGLINIIEQRVGAFMKMVGEPALSRYSQMFLVEYLENGEHGPSLTRVAAHRWPEWAQGLFALRSARNAPGTAKVYSSGAAGAFSSILTFYPSTAVPDQADDGKDFLIYNQCDGFHIVRAVFDGLGQFDCFAFHAGPFVDQDFYVAWALLPDGTLLDAKFVQPAAEESAS